MAWVIQRTAPGEDAAFWGKHDCWVHRGPLTSYGQVLKRKALPSLTLIFHDYDSAFDIAQHLRDTQPLAYGEVIAVVTEPEAVPA